MGLAVLQERRTLCSQPEELGGESAYTEIFGKYEGHCAVRALFTGMIIAVLPNVSEAESVACYASTLDGGFGSTVVVSAPSLPVTHETFIEWMC
jgi:hypothetical protein